MTVKEYEEQQELRIKSLEYALTVRGKCSNIAIIVTAERFFRFLSGQSPKEEGK